jgi:hypothetical protein
MRRYLTFIHNVARSDLLGQVERLWMKASRFPGLKFHPAEAQNPAQLGLPAQVKFEE